ncbi:cell division cycle-associated protein 7-like [Dendropsophus ebraccatus]|uniref:cell division cycle-associated protein 7-like n=1 Tax=Dendropsophus ebraccatus TaxID=150705 RepID=UPI0038312571
MLEECCSGNIVKEAKMSKSSKDSVPQKSQRYSLRVALKKPDYLSETSESEEEKCKSCSTSSDSEVEPMPMATPSDSEEEAPNEFLQKRAKNIRDNKAMLARLMADLEKLPGQLKAEPDQGASAQRYKRRPRESLANVQPRRNPERASRPRRLMRANAVGGSPVREPGVNDRFVEEREKNLEQNREQMMRRRRPARPSIHAIPHVVRPVEDITGDELNNVADNVSDKVYNAVQGSTCHQCRQKTLDTKTNCRNKECRGIQGQFCGPCLRNRYGEDVREALLNPDWTCPPCRGICNCSFCRQRDGRCATGILVHVAHYHGYNDVHTYLKGMQDRSGKKEEESDDD